MFFGFRRAKNEQKINKTKVTGVRGSASLNRIKQSEAHKDSPKGIFTSSYIALQHLQFFFLLLPISNQDSLLIPASQNYKHHQNI